MNSQGNSQCALCRVKEKACRLPNGIGPDFCPTKNHKKAIEKGLEEYRKPECKEFARMASLQEAEGYAGRHARAYTRALTEILKAQGFEVVSVVCKAGCTPKELIGIKDEEKVFVGKFEPMCSPIVQAMILNEEKTEFNILVGLCVGHDSLFFKYSEAFTTVFITKDRVLGHNPAAALYTSRSYYRRLLRPGFDVSGD